MGPKRNTNISEKTEKKHYEWTADKKAALAKLADSYPNGWDGITTTDKQNFRKEFAETMTRINTYLRSKKRVSEGDKRGDDDEEDEDDSEEESEEEIDWEVIPSDLETAVINAGDGGRIVGFKFKGGNTIKGIKGITNEIKRAAVLGHPPLVQKLESKEFQNYMMEMLARPKKKPKIGDNKEEKHQESDVKEMQKQISELKQKSKEQMEEIKLKDADLKEKEAKLKKMDDTITKMLEKEQKHKEKIKQWQTKHQTDHEESMKIFTNEIADNEVEQQ